MMPLTKRQLESLDISKNLAVTAGAGSGKTKVLVDRFLQILKEEPDLLPSNILALTFTEKASLEMKERIRKEIEALSDEEGERWDDALEDLEEPTISTIHSFCSSVIRSDPLSVGYDPDIRVLTENEISNIMNDLIRRTLTRQSPVSQNLRRLIVDYDQYHVIRMIRFLIRERSRLPRRLGDRELETLSIINARRTAEKQIELAKIELEEILPSLEFLSGIRYTDNGADSGVRVMNGISSLLVLVREGEREPVALMKEISASREVLLNRSGGERRASRLGNNRVWGLEHKKMKESVGELFSYAYRHSDALLFVEKEGLLERSEERIRDLLRVVSHVGAQYSKEKLAMNALDFDDQIQYAMDILEESDNIILSRLQKKYRHILIDEFQDTDPRQWRLAELLWNKGDGSRLFLVGDPKQSIYGFRSADVRLFRKAKEILELHIEGREVILDRNFRSSSEVMHFVNSVFPRVMEEQESGWSVPFDPLDPHRGDGGSINVVAVLGNERKEAREGKMAADIIRRAVRGWQIEDEDGKRGIRFSDIAILLPTRYGFERYEDALRDASIPYQVYKGKGFFERSEVMDVLDLLDLLTDMNDDLALVSLLKGPFFSLSDEDLVRLSLDVPGKTYWEKLKRSTEFSEISVILQDSLDKAGSLDPAILLEDLFLRTGVYASAGGRRQFRNLDKLLEWICDSAVGSTIPEIRDELKMLIDEPPKEGESPVNSDEDAVTVLTVHAAKGLEWPMVMVLGINHEGRGDQGDTVNLDTDMGIAMKVLDTTTGNIVATPAFKAHNDEKNTKESEEKKRLLYVACTRARDHLVLSGVIPIDRRGNEKEPKGMMKLLKDAMELSLEDLEKKEKVIGGVKVRLFPVRPDDPPAIDEEEEKDEIERPVQIRADYGQLDIGPVFSMEKNFESPTSEDVLSLFGNPDNEAPGYKRELGKEGPPPDELGEMVHRVLEGIPLKRILREYGYPGSGDLVKDLADAINRKVEALSGEMHYKEMEMVRDLEIDGEVHHLKGRLDLVIQKEDGSLLVVDHKTGKKRKEHETQLEAYRQMLREITGKDVEVKVLTPE